MRLLLLLLTLLWLPGLAQAEGPPTTPQLRVETGMHTAVINRIDRDQAERWVVTASDDKTVRVWDGRDGRLAGVLRPPIGAGNEGKLNAVAISPNGALVAAGGWTDEQNSIYLFDRATGRLLRRLTGLPNVIFHLSFSADGRYLAAGLGDGGIRVWTSADGRQVLADSDYAGDVYGLAFAADGRLASTAYDGQIRLYDAGLRRLASRPAPGGQRPYSLAFSPDGQKLAVGYADSTRVDVLTASTLAPLAQPLLTGIDNGDLSSVAWSGDGRFLFAGGEWRISGAHPIRRWSVAGGYRDYTDLQAGFGNTVTDLKVWGADGVLAGAGDPAWAALSGSGQRLFGATPSTADLRVKLGAAFTLAANGTSVRFGLGLGAAQPVRFDLTSRRLLAAAPSDPALAPPRLTGLEITGWENGLTPTLAGQKLALQHREFSRALAISSDAEQFVLGADYGLRLFDRRGQQRVERPVPGVAWGVNFSGDGRLVVAALADGTVRWYRASDLSELLALFVHPDARRWVAWTPSGYYMAGPDGEDLLGWHVNNGADQAADFYPAARFRDRFSRPDVVERILATLDEGQALRQADEAAKRRPDTAPLVLPPLVDILSPATGDGFNNSAVTLRYRLRSPSGQPVAQVRALIDGRTAEQVKGQGRIAAQGTDYTLTLSLPPQDVTIGLLAEGADGRTGPVSEIRLRWTGRAPGQDVLKPVLYVLAVGVSNYDDTSLKLSWAKQDAEDFATAIARQKGGLYRDVQVKLLPDADKNSILDGLDWLTHEVTSVDVGMVLLSGHGDLDQTGDFWFLPREANANRRRATMVSKLELNDTLRKIAGKVVLFIDACRAGASGRKTNLDVNGWLNELKDAENGAITFSSSTGKQLSLEDARWKNGAFTEALLEGMGAKADLMTDGAITLAELNVWLAHRVKDLTRGQQSPVMLKPDAIRDDLPLLLVR